MIKDEHGSLHRGLGFCKLRFDGIRWNSRSSICCSALRPGCASRSSQPETSSERETWELIVAAAALPLVLGDVDGDAVEVGGDQGFSAKAGQGAIEPQEDLLGEVVDVLTAASEAQEGAEDHRLMVANQLLEGEIGVQARVRQ